MAHEQAQGLHARRLIAASTFAIYAYLIATTAVIMGCSPLSHFEAKSSAHLSSSGHPDFARSPVELWNSYLSSYPQCRALIEKVNSGQDVKAHFQECINEVPEGFQLKLPRGVYSLSGTIEINKTVVLSTSSVDAGHSCALNEQHLCAELRAMPNALPEPLKGLLHISAEGASVGSIVINGNKSRRYNSEVAKRCQSGDNAYGYNVVISASKVYFVGNVSKNSVCASGLLIRHHATASSAVPSENLVISSNSFAYNGVHNRQGLWADGVTVMDAADSQFSGNRFVDNTDVDFIFGGCRRCQIQNNQLRHSDDFSGSSFAALMLHSWVHLENGQSVGQHTSGDYTDSEISGNEIDCGLYKRCGFGLYLGSESWYSANLYGGFVHDNVIRNAMTGLMIERPTSTIRIKDNLVFDSGGTFLTSAGMRVMPAYGVADFSFVQFEDSVVPRNNYVQVSLSRAIPNWHTEDSVPQLTPIESLVRTSYKSILKREPDSNALKAYSQFLQTGGTLSAIKQQLEGSEEFRHVTVANLYRQILGREGSLQDILGWANVLKSGQSAPSDLRNAFVYSPEAVLHLHSLYQTHMGKAPAKGDIRYWQEQLADGLTLSAVEDFLSKSVESQKHRIRKLLESKGQHVSNEQINTWHSFVRQNQLTLSDIRELLAHLPQSPEARP